MELGVDCDGDGGVDPENCERADLVRRESGGSDADQPERRIAGGGGSGFYVGGFGESAGVVPAVGEIGEASGGGVGRVRGGQVTGDWWRSPFSFEFRTVLMKATALYRSSGKKKAA